MTRRESNVSLKRLRHALIVKLPPQVNKAKSIFMVYHEMPEDDNCEDAGMSAILMYLRGSRHLVMPEEWRPVI